MNIDYIKRSDKVLENIESKSNNKLSSLQYYNPLYTDFFNFKDSNWKHVALNNEEHVEDISKMDDSNDTVFDIVTQEGRKRKVFFKYSPLLDPLYYITGYYHNKPNAFELPQYGKQHTISKVDNIHNSAYIDNFFYYLADKIGKNYRFPHSLEYYGSFLGLKKDFRFDISDDLDTLEESIYFHKNHGKSFHLEKNYYSEIFNSFTRKNREPLQITIDEHKSHLENSMKSTSDNNKDNAVETDEYPNVIHDLFHMSRETSSEPNENDNDVCIDYTDKLEATDDAIYFANHDESSELETYSESESDSESESTSFKKENADNEKEDTDFTTDEDESDDEGDDSDDDGDVFACINEFPTQMICLEKLYDTLDNHMENSDISVNEWSSILIQIIMTLSVYQKVFDFTHNDLHTNNVMYQKTKHKFILYKINDKYYEIPTYGRIYKLIDFGRAIFRFKNKRYCSDSYEPLHGDASTQYNCEPFFNPDKPVIEPNPSFDICRLSCSLYDYFLHHEEHNIDHPIFNLVREWCIDDEGKHVLYKNEEKVWNNPDYELRERFPGFKLYKYIARLVTKHIPKNIIQHEHFSNFKVNAKRVKTLMKRNIPFIDVDVLEPLYQ